MRIERTAAGASHRVICNVLAELDDVFDVRPHGIPRGGRVAPLEPLQNPLHLLVGFPDPQRPRHRAAPDPANLVDEVKEVLRDELVAGGVIDGDVHVEIELQILVHAVAGDRWAEGVERSSELPQGSVADPLRGKARHVGLENQTEFQHIVDLLAGQSPDITPALGRHRDPAFALKPRERRSNRRASDAELDRKPSLGEFLARRVACIDDPPLDLAVSRACRSGLADGQRGLHGTCSFERLKRAGTMTQSSATQPLPSGRTASGFTSTSAISPAKWAAKCDTALIAWATAQM